MKFTKEPPYDLNKLACMINSIIDNLNLDVEKLKQPSIGDAHNALIRIGFGYKPTFSLSDQWLQLVDILDKLNLDTKTRDAISKSFVDKYEYLKTNRKLI